MSDTDKRQTFIAMSIVGLFVTLVGLAIAIFDKDGFNWKPLVAVLLFDTWLGGVRIVWGIAYKKYPNDNSTTRAINLNAPSRDITNDKD